MRSKLPGSHAVVRLRHRLTGSVLNLLLSDPSSSAGASLVRFGTMMGYIMQNVLTSERRLAACASSL